jgi:hypothetical protein
MIEGEEGNTPLPPIFTLREKGDYKMNNKNCIVKNRGAAHVSYRIPEEGIRRSFAPGESKTISYEELEKLTYQPGGMQLITSFLQIQDINALNTIGAKVEPEYHMSEKDVANLLMSGSLDAFLDALDFAPVSVVDLIKTMAVSLPLMDMNKRKALKEKTGFDVEAALKHIEEEKEDDKSNTILKQTGERRVQPEAAPAGRRTAAPKYNVVKQTATAETAE